MWRWLNRHADFFETFAWALVVWAASIYIVWSVAP